MLCCAKGNAMSHAALNSYAHPACLIGPLLTGFHCPRTKTTHWLHYPDQFAVKVGVSTYVQAALRSEFSDIVADLCKPVAAAALPPERLVITDEDLMHDPIQTVQSSLPDFDLDD